MSPKQVSFYITCLLPEQQKKIAINQLSIIKLGKGKIFTDEQNHKAMRYHVHKNNEDFLWVEFRRGVGSPRPESVVNTKTEVEEDNPLNKNHVEMNQQMFVMLNIKNYKLYISDLNMKRLVIDWFSDKLGQEVIIRNVLNTADFLKGLNTLKKIRFAEDTNLLNDKLFENSLHGITDKENIYKFGGNIKQIELTLKFDNCEIDKNLLEEIKKLLGKKYIPDESNNLVIVGTTDKNFERIFNAKGVVDKIKFDSNVNDRGFWEVDDVFNKLQIKINAL